GDDDPVVTAHLRASEASFHASNGELGAAMRASEAAFRGFDQIGDRPTAMVERAMAMTLMCDLGLYQDVVALAPSSIADGTAVASAFAVAIMRTAHGWALRALGDHVAARRELEAAVAMLGTRQ